MSELGAVKKPLVLFVDDVPDIRQLIEIGVRHYDPPFDAAFAENSDEALEIVRERSPAAVVLDVNLAGETGIALGWVLQENYPHIAKAVLTAYDRGVTREHADELGMPVWSKPVDMAEIIRRVGELLAGKPAAPDARPQTGTPVSMPEVLRRVTVTLGLLGGAQVHKLL